MKINKSISLDKKLLKLIILRAKKEGRSVSNMIEIMAKEYLKNLNNRLKQPKKGYLINTR